MAFTEIASKDPPRYTDLCGAVNKAFEEVGDSIGPEEFKTNLGDLSFLKNQKNVSNLLFTLKTQLVSHMSQCFGQIIEDENLTELFSEKDSLTEEIAHKYLVDNDSVELIELEESLRQLDLQIAELETKNEVLLNQGLFIKNRFDQLTERLTKLINECEAKYTNCDQQADMIRKEFTNMLKE